MKYVVFFLITMGLFFTSCISLETGSESNYFHYLPEESAAYAYIDGQANKELIEEVVYYVSSNSNFLRNFISKKTDHILVALNPNDTKVMDFSILLLGRFSSLQINTALLSQKDQFDQIDRKRGWWHSKVLGFHIASPLNNMLYISTNQNTKTLLDRFNDQDIVEAVDAIFENEIAILSQNDVSLLVSDFSLFTSMAQTGKSGGMSLRLPMDKALFFASSMDSEYSFQGSIDFETEKDARISWAPIKSILALKLFQYGITDSFYNRDLVISRDENRLNISGLNVGKDKLLPLLQKLFENQR